MKAKVAIAALFFMLFSAVPISHAAEPSVTARIKVITTLFPLYDFAREVGKDKVEVSLLVPPGVEPHDFEPKPSDVVKINKADIFIYTGRYMEPWVEDALKGTSNKKLAVVDASKGIRIIEGDVEGHFGKDPHIWLDFDNAKAMVNNIAGAFAEKDGGNAEFYLDNAKSYNARLTAIDGRFKEAIAGCKNKTFIFAGHFAFGYFVKHYGLTYLSPYRGFSPDAEPTPKSLVELINKMKQLNIKYVYYGELVDPKVARVIGEETGAKLLLLDAAHNVSKEDMARGVTFVSIMEKDLENLKLGLGCR